MSVLYPLHHHMPRRRAAFSRWLGQRLMRLAGWGFEGEPPNIPKLVLSVAPHTSNWDFVIGVIAMWALDVRIRFLGKHTLFVWPFSVWLKSIGGIPVDRSASHGVVGQAIDAFRDSDAMWLAIAPEGTRRKVERYKSGFLHIAAGANVPIVLVCFDYRKRVIGFGPVMNASGDTEADLVRVETFYKTVHARRPENA